MYDVPEELWPTGVMSEKEPFQRWWERAHFSFPNIPRNVAKHWLYPYRGLTPFSWLPLDWLTFTCERWPATAVLRVLFDNEHEGQTAESADWGDFQREPKPMFRNWLALVMERRGTWPVPPLILDNRYPSTLTSCLPSGHILIEGHRRLSIARSLARSGELASQHIVWSVTLVPPSAG